MEICESISIEPNKRIIIENNIVKKAKENGSPIIMSEN
jgi:hypothetical protein